MEHPEVELKEAKKDPKERCWAATFPKAKKRWPM
jgi:hypothetical protein